MNVLKQNILSYEAPYLKRLPVQDFVSLQLRKTLSKLIRDDMKNICY